MELTDETFQSILCATCQNTERYFQVIGWERPFKYVFRNLGKRVIFSSTIILNAYDPSLSNKILRRDDDLENDEAESENNLNEIYTEYELSEDEDYLKKLGVIPEEPNRELTHEEKVEFVNELIKRDYSHFNEDFYIAAVDKIQRFLADSNSSAVIDENQMKVIQKYCKNPGKQNYAELLEALDKPTNYKMIVIGTVEVDTATMVCTIINSDDAIISQFIFLIKHHIFNEKSYMSETTCGNPYITLRKYDCLASNLAEILPNKDVLRWYWDINIVSDEECVLDPIIDDICNNVKRLKIKLDATDEKIKFVD